MNKKEETTEDVKEVQEGTKEEVKTVSLAQVPTQMGLVYRTPAGDLGQEEYLVWLGNMFLDFKTAIAGN